MSDTTAQHPPTRTVAVVPHTHWDREWYLPFQAFRMGLVEMLDEFLPRLETDPDYDRFLLDGQMAVVDDYLEMRPDALDQLQRLAAAGRVTVGPWYILMDEFLVSGETMIRNLQLGLRRAEALGGAMSVGYLPDMFGHVGQMPQLLRLAGFEHAVVWRGVPAAVDRSAFWWRAPDGSTVRAEYLLGGYGSGAAIPAGAAALVRRVSAYEQEAGSFALTPDAPLLWMNGTDHHAPQPWLGRVLTEANASQDRYHFAVSSLPEYLAKAPTDGLPVWPGELRSGARANLLMGVASNRVDVKIAAARAERALERVAEPLCALWLPAGTWPVAELAQAWTQVIRNSAHDSICACSHDRVGAAVLHRYDEALTIAEALRGRALAAAAAVLPKGLVVLNPSGRARSGVIEMVVPGDAAVPGAQVLDQVAPGVLELAGTGAMLAHLLSRLEAADFRPDHASHISLVEGETGIDLSLTIEPQRRPDLANESILSEAGALAGAQSDRPLRIRAERAGWQRVAVHVSDVPGFGWASWHPEPLTVAPVTITLGKGPAGSTTEPAAPKTGSAQDLTPFATPINVVGATGSTTANAATIGNGVIDVAVDPEDGTWSIARPGQSALPALQGLGRLVDDGDGGDTYNYSPPQVDTVVDQPDSVAVEIIEAGPVRGIVRVIRRYRWPDRLVGGARLGQRVVEVATDLELRAGEDVLRVTTSFDNQCRDHRLRAWFPLPAATTRSRAECAFATVERGLEAEGGPGEYGLPTFPSRRFVSAGGLTVLHEGLLEYELVAGGTALALTVLRATGMLSRPVMAYRDNSAGPAMPLEGPQMRGQVTVRYALYIETPPGPRPIGGPDSQRAAGDVDLSPSAIPIGRPDIQKAAHLATFALADQVWVPLEVTEGTGRGPERGSRLQVIGAEVSAVQRVDGRLEVRVFNPCDDEATVAFEGRDGWLVDLRGTPLERFEGAFNLRPWGIATVRLDA